MDVTFTLLTWFINDMRLLTIAMLFSLGDAAIQCYICDNLSNPSCSQYFKAYQFESIVCPTKKNGDEPWCGKQQQPPLYNGWVGVIRTCYYPGDLPDMNETLGCHQHMSTKWNFTATYCLCDRDLCNGATSVSALQGMLTSSSWIFSTHALGLLTSFASPLIITSSALSVSFLHNLN